MADDLYDVYYEKYTLLHSLYGADRGFLTRDEYRERDRELLALMERTNERDVSEDEILRIKELEYLLLDDISEGFFR